MNPGELTLLLDRLLAASDEHEWVEFKHDNDEPHAIGEYLSALANAAALDGEPLSYLVSTPSAAVSGACTSSSASASSPCPTT